MYQLFFVGFLSSTIFQQHPSADRHTSVTSDTWTTPLRTCPCRPAPTSPTNTSQHRMHQRHPLRYRTFLLGIHVVGLEGFFFVGIWIGNLLSMAEGSWRRLRKRQVVGIIIAITAVISRVESTYFFRLCVCWRLLAH